MGRYKYSSGSLKSWAYLIWFVGIPVWVLGLLFMYSVADSSRGSWFNLMPPSMRPYALVFLLLVISGIFWYLGRQLLTGPKIEGGLTVDAGNLVMTVDRGNGREYMELDIKSLTFIENGEDRMKVASVKGEYIFAAQGFSSLEEYERFRTELVCEKYKE